MRTSALAKENISILLLAAIWMEGPTIVEATTEDPNWWETWFSGAHYEDWYYLDANLDALLEGIEDEREREMTRQWHDVCSPQLKFCNDVWIDCDFDEICVDYECVTASEFDSHGTWCSSDAHCGGDLVCCAGEEGASCCHRSRRDHYENLPCKRDDDCCSLNDLSYCCTWKDALYDSDGTICGDDLEDQHAPTMLATKTIENIAWVEKTRHADDPGVSNEILTQTRAACTKEESEVFEKNTMSAFMFKLRSQSLLVIRTCCAFAQYVANGIGRNEGCAGSWDNTCAPRMECCPGSASSSNTDYCCPAGEHKLATQGGYYCQLDKDCYSGHCCSNGSCCTYMEQQKECYSDRDCHPAQQCCHDVNNLNDQSHCCYASDDNSQNDTTDYTLWLIFSVGGTLTFLCIVPILIGVCFVCLNNDTINRTKAASARRHHSRTHGATNRIAQAPATHDPKMHSSQMNNPQYLSMGSNSTNLGFHQSTQSNYGFVVPPSNTANRQQLPPLKSQHPTSTTLTTPAVPHLSRPAAVDASTIPPPPVYYPLVFR